jgi:protoporphyrin/coproporphyrin ferrochelatase
LALSSKWLKKLAKPKYAVLLVNLGTPDSTAVPDVRRYLREFLLDGRVIDISALGRWMLVNLIIAPFRAPRSARVYRKLWQERGSPLLFYGIDVRDRLREALGEEYAVELGMRYQNPSLEGALQALLEHNPERLVVVPLFPQYASATTGSVHQKVMDLLSGRQVIPETVFISRFAEDDAFIAAFASLGRKYLDRESYDHVLFSYHGIPERQIRKASHKGYCQLSDKCCATYNPMNRYCYRAQCFQTSRRLAEALGLTAEQYTVVFQSRLGRDPWIQPYAEDVIRSLPDRGKKRVLAFSPSFIADCLETTVEVGEEFEEFFHEAGGEHWQLVESLNDSPEWIGCLKEIVRRNI